MVEEVPYAIWLDQIKEANIGLLGGKAKGLVELIKNNFPVPPGFVITAETYNYFVKKTGLKEYLNDVIMKIKSLKPSELERISNEISKKFETEPMPDEIKDLIEQYYINLGKRLGIENPRVAVRSSATLEDISNASFAGIQDTYLNVQGIEDLIKYIKMVWASIWTSRALVYRESLGMDHSSVSIAVIVQKMVNSKSSGVMFTVHPATGESNKIVIESSWGLGELIVGGIVTPDSFVLDKDTLNIIERRISIKKIGRFYDPIKKANVDIELLDNPENYPNGPLYDLLKMFGISSESPSLSDNEIKYLAEIGKKAEAAFNHALDMEWAVDMDLSFPYNVLILQARFETVWSRKNEMKENKEGDIITRGLPASPGVASGYAKVVKTVNEAAEKMKEGDVLITKMTDPDWVPYMKIASAIITDEGGMTAHAAIVARELGKPAVVGTGNATNVIKDSMPITVDGSRGVVTYGITHKEETKKESEKISLEFLADLYPVTGTKIYMNLGEPDEIDRYVNLPFDGIGLMRVEFIISSKIGYHPLYLIDQGKPEIFVDGLADGIAKVAAAISPRPLVVRFSDFKTNEYSRLKGGDKYEPSDERNPMIGWRGVSRYIQKPYEPAFRLEVRAIKKVREEMGLKNVYVMFPFVRTTWELERAMKIMEEEGLRRGKDFKVWIMVEVPSTVILAEEFAKMVDGFSVGSNDLTQLTLGVDRDSSLLAKMGYFDERDPAVLKSIGMLIDAAHKYNATVSICGQAPSVYPEIVENLVRKGIDSISVNPDAVIRVRRHVASVERRILVENSIKKS
ncbi:phosphoenolpyruvate synthase [Caldisphaera lagunensis DSM 15908]|uniref:Phosphoenolpyruvate synthase n=1 Tax=Caldisphaera lagunensis (strain DSM 15908 / JCM 11604 / ANMR 0165 / IC-154) TaxID=1056495 RepID=L0ACU0_CALLD|nr:phosphoenolpyruvate synthase [Caldisphaera lagunensis DSM 15908]